MRRSVVFIISLFFCVTVFARQSSVIDGVSYPANSAEVWLQKFRDALHNRNYKITFVVTKGDSEVHPYLWRHGILDGITMEHLSQLNGPGSETFRINDKVSFFYPDIMPFSLHSNHINGPIPFQFFEEPLELSNAYSFLMVGRSRVSGRAAQQIRIISDDGSRYNTTLWLDQETGLLLKMDLLDLKGELLEQLQVTSIAVTDEPDPYFERIDQSRLPDITSIKNGPDVQFNWRLNYIPQGMEVVKKDRRRLTSTQKVVEYMMLSDGLVDVSVYISQNVGNGKDSGWLKHGSDTLLTISQGPFMVTVIGKVPPETARRIATSVGPESTS